MACSRNPESANFVQNGKKIIGVALNYMCAVKARNVAVPTEPIVFIKPTSSYIREGCPIVLPKVFTKVAYEVELGVVIGSRCKNVSKSQAMDHVSGYCLALDLTAQCHLTASRASGGSWTLGKGFDTATPVSSFIPKSAVKDAHALPLWLKVNGETKQDGCTADLIFKVPDIISYVSQYMTLEKNDLILTGTPHGSEPFKAGDVIECGLADLACIKFNVCAE